MFDSYTMQKITENVHGMDDQQDFTLKQFHSHIIFFVLCMSSTI